MRYSCKYARGGDESESILKDAEVQVIQLKTFVFFKTKAHHPVIIDFIDGHDKLIAMLKSKVCKMPNNNLQFALITRNRYCLLNSYKR
jgi:hypothetical protein